MFRKAKVYDWILKQSVFKSCLLCLSIYRYTLWSHFQLSFQSQNIKNHLILLLSTVLNGNAAYHKMGNYNFAMKIYEIWLRFEDVLWEIYGIIFNEICILISLLKLIAFFRRLREFLVGFGCSIGFSFEFLSKFVNFQYQNFYQRDHL